ncbi:RNA-binding protein 45-like [Leptidea sinapis]|uniref:RNA-binding protein 45-like n=1 Tax=Leptidea sinapis TaxID=189913 RepID=UPI0021C2EFD8|nr:RNA-binding protein 45-like [Leptidea sinapis]
MNTSNNDDRKDDNPPFSRIFVVCNKHMTEEDLRTAFSEYGDIEDLYIPRHRLTGEHKGVAYIKYSKTSSAAAAIKALHLNHIKDGKPIKVMVAASKNEPPSHDQYGDKYTRLFIKVARDVTDSDIRKKFSNFGQIDSIFILKDKETGLCKGFAYVKFKEFLEAAKAFEECDPVYKPVFAMPKDLKRNRNSYDCDGFNAYQSKNLDYRQYNSQFNFDQPRNDISNKIKSDVNNYKTVSVNCRILDQRYIEQLFNLIPGMVHCHYTIVPYSGQCKALVTYEEPKYAAYAVEKLNNYEFPSGEILSVTPDTNPLAKAATDLTSIVNQFKNNLETAAPDLIYLANAIEKASSLIKDAAAGKLETPTEHDSSFSSIPLPPIKPMSNSTKVAKRLFIVCKPQPPPVSTLQDVFCRFGDLINVATFPNKTFGFVKYASDISASEAMNHLNGATIYGIRLKVMEADEKPQNNVNEKIGEDDSSNQVNDIKRVKLD